MRYWDVKSPIAAPCVALNGPHKGQKEQRVDTLLLWLTP